MNDLDALRPARLGTSVRYLGTLPAAPGIGWWLLFSLFFGAMAGANLVFARFIGTIVDEVRAGNPVMVTVAVVAAALIAQQIFTAIGEYITTVKVRRLSVDLRRACLEATLTAPVPEILALGSGNVVTRLTKDIDTVVRIVVMIHSRAIFALLSIPATFVALAFLSWQYAVIVVLVLPLSWLLMRRVVAAMPRATDVVSTAQARRNNILLDALRGVPTLRALSLLRWAHQRSADSSWQAVQAWADRMPLLTRVLRNGYIVYFLLIGAVILTGTWLVGADAVTIGVAVAAVVYVARLEMPIFNVLFFASEIQQAMTCLGRAVALAQLGEQVETAQPADLTHTLPTVEITDLHYAYPSTHGEIFSGLSLTLTAGTTTALVGASGAGKSTLAGVIAGLYRPDSGQITVGGVDTATVADTWTARHVALISQEVHLFSGSVRDDLRLAAPQASDEQILAALAAVGLDPDSPGWRRYLTAGLETQVGAGAPTVGPEVRQQISLARIILLDPPVLIMDEATAEAGSEDADVLGQAAARVARGRTSLVVAHRLDQAAVADRVVVMEQGEIIEDGTHAELVVAGGRYQRLWEAWAS